MPSSETIELKKIKSVVGSLDDNPKPSPTASITSKLRTILLKMSGQQHLIAQLGATGISNILTCTGATSTGKCMHMDKNNLYVALEDFLIKINISTYSVESIISLTPSYIPEKIISDGLHLYLCINSIPTTIIKVNIDSFTIVDSIELETGEIDSRDMYINGSNLYVALKTTPAKIITIDLDTFTRTSVYTLPAGQNDATTLASDGIDLYAGLYLSPIQVVKIPFDTFTISETLTLDTGENSGSKMMIIDPFIYMASDTSPGQIIKIDIRTFTKIETITFDSGLYDIGDITTDGTFLYCGLNTVPGKIIKIDLANFEVKGLITFATDEDYIGAMITDTEYLYSLLKVNPPMVKRIYTAQIPPLNDRKISNIDEQLHSGTHHLYPTKAASTSLSTGNTAWDPGSYTEIIPVDTIKTRFYINGLILNNLTIDSEYEIDIATGASASEIRIGSYTHESHDTNASIIIPIHPPIKIESNTRISAKASNENIAIETCTVKLMYYTYT